MKFIPKYLITKANIRLFNYYFHYTLPTLASRGPGTRSFIFETIFIFHLFLFQPIIIRIKQRPFGDECNINGGMDLGIESKSSI